MNDITCNNCGKQGHLYHQCKLPITSIGIIVFRIRHTEDDSRNSCIEYLMIRRKDTLGYIDFMRGKYSVYNKEYIMNMMKQMTNAEKKQLKTLSFNELWKDIWGDEHISNQYKMEEIVSLERFESLRKGVYCNEDFYTLDSIIDESNQFEMWEEQEWGFPKGRRNHNEKDFQCALREFQEETGINIKQLKNIDNIMPFEESFTGSNYKSYKHKYYLAFLPYEHSLNIKNFEPSEVSKMEWKTYDECMACIRSYNLEKKRLITNIHNSLTSSRLFFI